jgi:predicted methyltransferase
MTGDDLDRFISDILEAKKLSGVDADVRTQLIGDLKQQLLDQINRALIDALPEDKLDQFNILLEDPSTTDESIQSFIATNGVDVTRVTAQTMLRFRDLYLEPAEDRA